ncbi:MAG: 4'-phosphopantetheinyl transferase superfamily protein [Methylococcales bacterium]|nr:4'-phosphopantetheinyl transferase superfamily protein [Methylococcales bacterium]MDD5753999.1 4'-phosphopantetheinyl transferase superfamily protein [Methylococcales bacterium]
MIDVIRIYYHKIERQLSENKFQALCQQLPDAAQLKILQYRRWQDGHAMLFGRLLLKIALLEEGYPSMCLEHLWFDKYNRPFIDSGVDFNISHSGNYVLCAITRVGRIGIDIEQIKATTVDDFKSFFSNDEWCNVIYANDPVGCFYHYWTIKESTMKADGRGLSIPPQSIISHSDYAVIDNKKWGLKKIDIDMNQYSCHLAFERYDTFHSSSAKHDIIHYNLDGTFYPVSIIEIEHCT